MQIDPAISSAFSLSLAALIAAAAVHKTKAPAGFISVVRNYRVLPRVIVPAVAVLIVVTEFAVAAGLALLPVRSVAAIGAAALFTIYAAAIGVNLLRGRTAIDCGCSFGGNSADRISPSLIARNAALVCASLVAAMPVSARALGSFDFLSTAVFVAAATSLYLAGEVLRTNAVKFRAMESAR